MVSGSGRTMRDRSSVALQERGNIGTTFGVLDSTDRSESMAARVFSSAELEKKGEAGTPREIEAVGLGRLSSFSSCNPQLPISIE
jgi:hypothetical protein